MKLETIFISQASLEHDLVGTDELQAECIYLANCKLAKKGKIDCFNDEAIQNCQSYKFYQRYPNYEQMFIGSKI